MDSVKQKRPAVFLDRDGTVNVEKGYFYRPEDFEFEQGSIEAIRLLNQAGFRVIIISNQAGVALGHFSEGQLNELHKWLAEELAKHGTHIDEYCYCPHHAIHGLGRYKTVCGCRKPAPGLLLKAAEKWNIDLERSYMVGDHNSDVEAGRAAGVKPILVLTGHGRQDEPLVDPDVPRAGNLIDAVTRYILG